MRCLGGTLILYIAITRNNETDFLERCMHGGGAGKKSAHLCNPIVFFILIFPLVSKHKALRRAYERRFSSTFVFFPPSHFLPFPPFFSLSFLFLLAILPFLVYHTEVKSTKNRTWATTWFINRVASQLSPGADAM